jgi:hyperosmotically inducible protein
MKTLLATAGLLMGALVVPLASHAADKAPAATPSTSESMSATKPSRSAHPIDDAFITTKVKAQFIQDKVIRKAHINVKTVNGEVQLSGTADSKKQVSKAVSVARKVKGVKSVKNDVEVVAKQADTSSVKDRSGRSVQTAPSEASAMEKTKPQSTATTKSGSNQPVEDTVITTKVKALMVKDKDVSASSVEVKTVNGVVHLTGTAKSRQEADKAVSIARGVTGVTSVQNDIKVQ